jgi:hypothetical protein
MCPSKSSQVGGKTGMAILRNSGGELKVKAILACLKSNAGNTDKVSRYKQNMNLPLLHAAVFQSWFLTLSTDRGCLRRGF